MFAGGCRRQKVRQVVARQRSAVSTDSARLAACLRPAATAWPRATCPLAPGDPEPPRSAGQAAWEEVAGKETSRGRDTSRPLKGCRREQGPFSLGRHPASSRARHTRPSVTSLQHQQLPHRTAASEIPTCDAATANATSAASKEAVSFAARPTRTERISKTSAGP